MTETVTVKTPGDIANLIPRLMGFVPEDSLVVIPTGGGGPTARVDLATPRELAAGLQPALAWWRQVLVALYTDDSTEALRVAESIGTILPGVEVVAMLRVADNCTFDPLAADAPGEPFAPAETGTALDTRTVAPSRKVIEDEAQVIADAKLAEKEAIAAYEAGNGARAWAFYDRAVELRGHESKKMAELHEALANAIRPARLGA